MTWCNESNDVETVETNNSSSSLSLSLSSSLRNRSCPSCGHQIKYCQQQGSRINELPGLPAGVRFDPTDQELIRHLEGKVKSNGVHPLIDEFIQTLEGENGICYTHPEKLPGVTKNGQVRHFFHRPSRAYTTGTRKRRKVDTDEDGSETRWHKTGKTRPVLMDNKVIKGYKKILVLYTNYGKQRKPEKTNWIMHQYHLGISEDEKDGELVVSKVFYQTQPRQCGASVLKLKMGSTPRNEIVQETNCSEHHHPSMISFDQRGNQAKGSASTTTIFPFCCP